MRTFRNSISCLLIAGLITAFCSTAEAQDDLILWFPFEGSGDVAEDASGNGNNGSIIGAERAPGKYGKGIAIGKQGQYVEISNILQPSTTIAFWFKPNWSGSDAQTYRLFDANTGAIYFMIGKGKAVGDRETTFGFYLEDASDADFQDWETPATNAIPTAGVWYHLTTTWDFNAGEAKFYINGQEVGKVAGLGNFPPLNANPKIGFNVGVGYMAAHNGADGIIDEFAIYARAITAEEIQEVMKMGFAPGVARNPSPAHEATDVPREVVLSWTPGEYAPPVKGHKVYLSENFNDVNDGVGGVAQDANSYTPDPRLNFGTTYYWRVDEVNGPPDFTVYPGDVWNFTTEPVGYAIENITATASSAHQADMGPENTINGSGLDANDLHSKEPTDMWLSSTEPLGAWIEFQFDNVYKLHEMWVWNSNQMIEPLLGFGFKAVTIEYSANGTDWTTLADVPEFAQAPGTPGYAHNTVVGLGGVGAKYVRLTTNSSWGGVMPQFGLSEVRFFYIPVWAREPSPDSGATDVDVNVTLGWRAGREAAKHDMYFDTHEQAVIDGTAPVTTVNETSYGPLSLDLGMTYSWKVNEVNDAESPAMWEGNVWNFMTPDYLVVDDFESYNDLNPEDPESNRIFMAWLDGYEVAANGSIVGNDVAPFAEQAIVHSGEQSMPFFYNNTGGAAYSEAELTLSPPQDWSKHGVKTLSLRFYGDPNNTPVQMYVKVNSSKVTYDGDAGNSLLRGWQAWNIDLASVSTNLQNITNLAIGIDGNGAVGKLLFDDIRLYPYERQFVTPVEPGPANLVGHWQLDGNLDDSSGNNRHGTAMGGPTFVAGKVGQAINLDGVDDYVNITGYKGIDADRTDPNNPVQRPFTVACWVNSTGDGSLVCWGSSDGAPVGGQYQNFRIDGGRLRAEHGNGRFRGATMVSDSKWHHVAMVVAEGANIEPPRTQLYVDGLKDTQGADTVNAQNIWNVTAEADVAIGIRASHVDRFFTGMLDDARIYDRALTEEEVAWLAGRTQPYDKPF